MGRNALLAEGFGFVERIFEPSATYYAAGAIINGVSYGNLTALSKKEDAVIPKKISLEQNYPNPFNPVTTIEYKTTTPSLVKLVVFNPLGQTVAILVNEFQKPGRYKVNFNANSLKSGSYFYRLSVKGKSLTKKMIILR